MGKKSKHTSQPGDKKFVSKTKTCEQKCIALTLQKNVMLYEKSECKELQTNEKKVSQESLKFTVRGSIYEISR